MASWLEPTSPSDRAASRGTQITPDSPLPIPYFVSGLGCASRCFALRCAVGAMNDVFDARSLAMPDHFRAYQHADRNKWAMGSVHHEHRDGDGKHRIDRTFEQQARNLGYMMRVYGGWCVDKKWLKLPGSAGVGPKRPGLGLPESSYRYSDGYLTRFTHPGAQQCN